MLTEKKGREYLKDEQIKMAAQNPEERAGSEETGERFRILEHRCDMYRGRCRKLQKENERLKNMLDQIQKMVC